jgi:hypothetical protein
MHILMKIQNVPCVCFSALRVAVDLALASTKALAKLNKPVPTLSEMQEQLAVASKVVRALAKVRV